MRENMGLYRGKRIDGHRDNTKNGTMLYGSLFIDKNGQPKIKWYCEKHGSAMTSNVDPETVGQFTGLTDKNGVKIFEGDILEYNSRLVNIASGLPTGGNCTERSVVEWGGHCWNRKRIYHSQWNSNWRNYGFTTDLYPENAAKYAEVIGNIHDNPELLNKAENSAIDSPSKNP